MTYDQRMRILQFVNDYRAWPASATDEDRRELIRGGFVDVVLTSLGELEIGYPETDDNGDKPEDKPVSKTLTIFSSNGELCVDVSTGLVDKGASDYYDTDELKHISQFNIEEFCVFWNCEPQDGDILDFGYWMDNGTYEPPAMDWRLDIAVQFLTDDIEWEDFGPTTPGEILELALNGKAFGAIPKETK